MDESLSFLEKKNILEGLIKIWNQERLTIYHMSMPDNNLEYKGIVRVCFHDESKQMMTKCFRITSTTKVIELLRLCLALINQKNEEIENFMMIESHSNEHILVLKKHDYPLRCQLFWADDGIDGKFIILPVEKFQKLILNYIQQPKKVEERLDNIKLINEITELNRLNENYTTIAHNDKIMERQRKKLISRKLLKPKSNKNIKNSNLDEYHVNTIRIFATSLFPDAPYKTLIVSSTDNARKVINEALEKFSLSGHIMDPNLCCLSIVMIPKKVDDIKFDQRKSLRKEVYEYMLPDDIIPLELLNDFSDKCDSIMFNVKRIINLVSLEEMKNIKSEKCREFKKFNKFNKLSPKRKNLKFLRYSAVLKCTSEMNDKEIMKELPNEIYLKNDVVIFGSDLKAMKNYKKFLNQKPTQTVLLTSNNILPCHCLISTIGDDFYVYLCDKNAEVLIDNEKMFESRYIVGKEYICLTIGYQYHFIVEFTNKEEIKKSEILPLNENINISLENIQEMPLLPLKIKCSVDDLNKIITYFICKSKPENCNYKLEPAFTLYLVICEFYNIYFPYNSSKKSNSSKIDKTLLLHESQKEHFVEKVEIIVKNLNQHLLDNSDNITMMIFWLSNLAQLQHFLYYDSFMGGILKDITRLMLGMLEEILKVVFESFEKDIHFICKTIIEQNDLVKLSQDTVDFILTQELEISETEFLQKNTILIGGVLKYMKQTPTINDIFLCLNSWLKMMCLLKVNSSFIVQFFQNIFSSINEYLIKAILKETLSEKFGIIFNKRFSLLRVWAEIQGLDGIFDECFKDCSEIICFLICSKTSMSDIKNTILTFENLSVENMSYMLTNYQFNSKEKLIFNDDQIKILLQQYKTYTFSKMILKVVKTTTFIIPDEDYVSSLNEFIGPHIRKFIDPLAMEGKCILFINEQDDNNCFWERRLKYVEPTKPIEPKSKKYTPDEEKIETIEEIINQVTKKDTFVIERKHGESLGLHIVSAKNERTSYIGIYINEIISGFLAEKSSKFEVGDQILSVNGKTLIGKTTEEAVQIIRNEKNLLKFVILKNSAKQQGIMEMIEEKSFQNSINTNVDGLNDPNKEEKNDGWVEITKKLSTMELYSNKNLVSRDNILVSRLSDKQ